MSMITPKSIEIIDPIIAPVAGVNTTIDTIDIIRVYIGLSPTLLPKSRG